MKDRSKKIVVHTWSTQEKEYLAKITPGHHYLEIQQLMNKKFNLNLRLNQIKGAISRYKLNTGLTGRFSKNHIPFNKGKNGKEYLTEKALEGMKKTQFKLGQTPVNHRILGSERINVDGYIEIKTAEPNKWRLKHQVVWEENNGSIPKGYAVIFGDRNKNNLDINNLILVSRKQLLTLNRYKLIHADVDLTKTGVVIADVYNKISERKNKTD